MRALALCLVLAISASAAFAADEPSPVIAEYSIGAMMGSSHVSVRADGTVEAGSTQWGRDPRGPVTTQEVVTTLSPAKMDALRKRIDGIRGRATTPIQGQPCYDGPSWTYRVVNSAGENIDLEGAMACRPIHLVSSEGKELVEILQALEKIGGI